jgi:hypothetical protein
MICGTASSSIKVNIDPLGIVVLGTRKFVSPIWTVVPLPPPPLFPLLGVLLLLAVGLPGRAQAASRRLPMASTASTVVRNPRRFLLMCYFLSKMPFYGGYSFQPELEHSVMERIRELLSIVIHIIEVFASQGISGAYLISSRKST